MFQKLTIIVGIFALVMFTFGLVVSDINTVYNIDIDDDFNNSQIYISRLRTLNAISNKSMDSLVNAPTGEESNEESKQIISFKTVKDAIWTLPSNLIGLTFASFADVAQFLNKRFNVPSEFFTVAAIFLLVIVITFMTNFVIKLVGR